MIAPLSIIAITTRRAFEKMCEMLIGGAAVAGITSQPGDDIRVLLGHDGRPPSPTRGSRDLATPSMRAHPIRLEATAQALH